MVTSTNFLTLLAHMSRCPCVHIFVSTIILDIAQSLHHHLKTSGAFEHISQNLRSDGGLQCTETQNITPIEVEGPSARLNPASKTLLSVHVCQ